MPPQRRSSRSISSRATGISASGSFTAPGTNPSVSIASHESVSTRSLSKASKYKYKKKKKRVIRNDDEETYKPDSAANSDYDLWEPSDSPIETWSDCENENDDGEWPVEKIISEDVTISGHVRY